MNIIVYDLFTNIILQYLKQLYKKIKALTSVHSNFAKSVQIAFVKFFICATTTAGNLISLSWTCLHRLTLLFVLFL